MAHFSQTFHYYVYVFMDDNAPVHTANLVKEYIANKKIITTSWPSQSPHLNIIENIWFKSKRTQETRAEFINTKQQLITEIRTAWENIFSAYIEVLYATFPGRLIEVLVLKIKGNLTKY